MRTNGDGGERFTARFTAQEPANEDEDAARDERDPARTLAGSEPVPASSTNRSTKGAKSRVKKGKSQPPKAVEKTAAKQAEKPVAKQPEKVVEKVAPKPAEVPAEKALAKQAVAKEEAPAEKAAPVAKAAKAPEKTSQGPGQRSGKRGKSKSIEAARQGSPSAPKARTTPTPAPVAATVLSTPAPASAPVSLDPRTTLRDHPVQKSAAAAARAATTPRRDDEISIPPTSSDPPVAGDLDERFFAEGEAAAHAAHAEAIRATKVGVEPLHAGDHDAHETGRRVVLVPPERRRKMANYVKVAVGFSAVLLLAAAVRVGIAHVRPTEAAAAVPVVVVTPPVPPPAPEVQAAQAAPAAVAPVTAATVAVEPPPPVPVDEPAAAAEPAPPEKTAKQEKEDARKSLERGKRKEAIESAQRSVDLDPTDAEAWLILGSAQQDSGKWKEAHESFVACTKQAKAGPIGECRMMLR
jgi:hypothetical protein